MAVVLQSTGSWYEVLTTAGRLHRARLRGVMRTQIKGLTNPVAVGDRVDLEFEEDGGAVISGIQTRENYIIRRSPRNRHKRHIVAANLDQAFLLVTLSRPRTSLGFIDRFLINTATYHIPTSIVFSKIDALKKKESTRQEEVQALYERLGHPCFRCSAVDGTGVEELAEALRDKVTLLAGHSGVGKSTLANAIEPGLGLRVREISRKTGKGMHTTTYATMHRLEEGGFLVDTPGIKEFGIVDLEENEVGRYFVEIAERMPHCRFHNCLHTGEPGCAVLEAVGEDAIALSRYESYLSILEDVRESAARR